jgi:apolipoprotein N-acyltransferase
MYQKNALINATEKALADEATIVVLPEDSRMTYELTFDETFTWLQSIPHAEGAFVVDSYRTNITQYQSVLRGYVYDISHRQVYSSDKQTLVPMGEFIPLIYFPIALLFEKTGLFDYKTYVESMFTTIKHAPQYIPNVLFCFESSSAAMAKKLQENHAAELMVHPVSHAWFNNPTSLWNQENQMLIVQALYTGVPILQAGNKAPSKLYAPDGTVYEGTQVTFDERTIIEYFSYLPIRTLHE